jgi:DNA-binding ferritin-like protein
MNDFQKALIILLGMLRALKWLSWNGHWQVKGNSFYGDHLMLERIYEGKLDEQIDTLAEKLVCLYGSDCIDSPYLIGSFNECVEQAKKAQTCPIRRVLHVLQYVQGHFAQTYKIGTSAGRITLGMDDFLMASANEQETFIYLVQQRLR